MAPFRAGSGLILTRRYAGRRPFRKTVHGAPQHNERQRQHDAHSIQFNTPLGVIRSRHGPSSQSGPKGPNRFGSSKYKHWLTLLSARLHPVRVNWRHSSGKMRRHLVIPMSAARPYQDRAARPCVTPRPPPSPPQALHRFKAPCTTPVSQGSAGPCATVAESRRFMPR